MTRVTMKDFNGDDDISQAITNAVGIFPDLRDGGFGIGDLNFDRDQIAAACAFLG